jgi:heat shock protein HslJ
LLLALLLILGGCGAATPTATPAATATSVAAAPANLAGTRWRLVSYGPADSPTAALPQQDVTLEFNQGNQISGSAGCNSYSGTATIAGETVKVGPLMSTKMACANQAANTQETVFLMALQAGQSIKVVGATLTIGFPAGVLTFSQQ